MDLALEKLGLTFSQKPFLIGGKSKEYYGIRKSGKDIDLVVSREDHAKLSLLYPENIKDLYGDRGVCIHGFEIWNTIVRFDYDFLSEGAKEMSDYKIISLEKLLILTAMAIRKPKYLKDLRLIVAKIYSLKYPELKRT